MLSQAKQGGQLKLLETVGNRFLVNGFWLDLFDEKVVVCTIVSVYYIVYVQIRQSRSVANRAMQLSLHTRRVRIGQRHSHILSTREQVDGI